MLAITLAACVGSGDQEPVPVPTFTIAGALPQVEVGTPLRLDSGVKPENAGFSYRWDFGDGSSSTSPTPEKAYANPGTYAISLTITGAAGDSKTASVELLAGRFSLVEGQRCTGALPNTGWCRIKRLPSTIGVAQFVDANHGWVLGAHDDIDSRGMVFRTTDGGQSWTPHRVGTGSDSAWDSFRFVDDRAGLLLSGEAGGYRVWTTGDGGVTWARRGTVAYAADEYAAPEWVSGDGMRILVRRDNYNVFLADPAKPLGYHISRDGGATWTSGGLASAVTPAGTLFQVQANRVLRSNDFGLTSTATQLSDAQTLRLVTFSGDDLGWIFGVNPRSEPTIWRTTNGGDTWTRVDIAQSTGRPGPMAGTLKAYGPETLWMSDARGSPTYRSSDGGATWLRVAAPSAASFGQIVPVSADLAHSPIGLSGGAEVPSIPLTTDGGRSWTNIPIASALNTRRLGSLSLVLPGASTTTMLLRYLDYAADEWYRSVDGGVNWVQTLGPLPGQVLTGDSNRPDIWFLDSQRWNTVTSVTKDSGRSWAPGQVRTFDNFATFLTRSNLQYRSGGLGWAVLDSPPLRVMRTTDHGMTWQEVELPPAGTLTNFSFTRGLVHFINDNVGWALHSGFSYQGQQLVPVAAIWSTGDGGQTWRGLGPGPGSVNRGLTNMTFVNDRTGFAAFNDGGISRTTDGGVTWEVSALADGSTPLGRVQLYFVDASLGFSFGENTLRRTSDGGANWTSIAFSADVTSSSMRINDIRFADTRTGWIVGDAGLILATKDGGLTWARQEAGSVTNLVGVYATDARTAWVVDRIGRPLVTATGGD